MIVGVTNMLTRLWESEHPDAVLVAWDWLEVPTYRKDAFDAYQSGRIFEDSLLEQLAVMPALTEALGLTVGKGAGYEADDFLAAAALIWQGEVLAATSHRYPSQLASD